MKTTPRKIYIIEDGSYTELSYQDFCHRKETDKSYLDKLFIPVQYCLIETDRAHYTEFYRDKERWRYLRKLDSAHHLLSIEAFENDDNIVDAITDEAANIEETVAHRMILNKLRASLTLLSKDEQELLNAIFFRGLSEREWSSILGISQSTVNYRKRKILTKLRKLLEK